MRMDNADWRIGDLIIDTVTGNQYAWFDEWKMLSYRWNNPQSALLLGTVSTPEKYGAVNDDRTLRQLGYSQEEINSKFPGTGATPDDKADWAATAMAIKNGDVLFLSKTYYWNRGFRLPKKLMVDGHLATVNLSGNNFSVFYRDEPASLNDAIANMGLYVFRDIVFNGNGTQTVIEPMSSYGSAFINLHFKNVKTCLKLNFSLMSATEGCIATYAENFLILDIMRTPWGTNSNSQCNHSWAKHNRGYNVDYFIQVFAASGVALDGNISEGKNAIRTITFDGMNSTVVKDFTVSNTHVEIFNGIKDCFILIKDFNGIAIIDKAYSQYPGIMVKAVNSKYAQIEVWHVPWWVSKNGKMFEVTGESPSWHFAHNDARGMNTKELASLFIGKAPAYCGKPGGCGYGRYTMIPMSR